MSIALIEPFKCRMYEKYLYNCEQGEELVDIRVLAVASYPGCSLTFEIEVLSNGALFSNIPIDALVQRFLEPVGLQWTYRELDYEYCDSQEVQVFKLPLPEVVQVWIKCKEVLTCCQARYMFSLDWTNGNTRQHMVALPNGQFALVPNHKMLTKVGKLPGYRKLRQEWK